MDDKALEEVFLSSREVFNGVLINVEHWQVALPNGEKALREIVRHRGAAGVVPLDDAGNVTMVRQHRIAVGRFTWEIPAGKLNREECGAQTTSQRESSKLTASAPAASPNRKRHPWLKLYITRPLF